MAELLYKDELYAIVGAAMDVYNDFGPGFVENVYQEAMEIELAARRIPSRSLQEVHIHYKGKQLKRFYIADFICYDKIIIERKAMDRLTLRGDGQLLNYLKTTGMKVGVLINFGHFPSLEWKRRIFTKEFLTDQPKVTLREDSADYQTPPSDDTGTPRRRPTGAVCTRCKC